MKQKQCQEKKAVASDTDSEHNFELENLKDFREAAEAKQLEKE
jgi:hypothetical protein